MNNEDIKVLEEYVEEFNENKKKYKMVYSTGFGKYWADFVQSIENLIKGYRELEKEKLSKSGIYKIGVDFDNDYIPKSKVREILDTKYIAMFEGDTEFPDDATIMKTVKYVKVSDIEELLQEGDK